MTPAPKITVVGLGPGHPDLIGLGARRALERIDRRFVRTRRHPSTEGIADARSFDDVYDAAASIDDVYPVIVKTLVEAARSGPGCEIVYAVPGSPLVAERTVELLRAETGVLLEVIPALSFVDLAWATLGIDPFAAGVRLVDGHRFATEAAGATGPLLVSQCDSPRVLSDIKLAVDEGPEVVVLARLGLPDEQITTLAWADLDRGVIPDHLTCLWIPGLDEPVAAEVVRFDELVRTLRASCPWDRKQTHASLTRHLIEESYEVVEAIDELTLALAGGGGAEEADAYDHLEEELGDLLFQVVFHTIIAAEAGRFTLADVARGIHDKLVRRHPHVFAPTGGPAPDAGAALAGWEHAKKVEKGRASVMDGIPATLPALASAAKAGRKASSVGFDWEDHSGVWAKIEEELAELRTAIDDAAAVPGGAPARDGVADELGDVLFSVVNLARHLEIDAEDALRAATNKFRARFGVMETAAETAGHPLSSLSVDDWERLWMKAKESTASRGPTGP